MIEKAISKINAKEMLDCVVNVKRETKEEVIFNFNKNITKEVLLNLELLLCSLTDGETFLVPLNKYKDNIKEVSYKKTNYENACNLLIEDILD